MAKGFFIQYKFVIPENIKHNSYTYQKLFRAIYGYTQNVTKSNGKTYTYHRKGVLSTFPHIRPGKNCVIIPTSAFNQLTTFFKTGKNPAHYWRIKGDWKAVFYMNEKTVSDEEAIEALEKALNQLYIDNQNGEKTNIDDELNVILDGKKSGQKVDANYVASVLATADKLTQNEWFKEFGSKSQKLSNFSKKLKELK